MQTRVQEKTVYPSEDMMGKQVLEAEKGFNASNYVSKKIEMDGRKLERMEEELVEEMQDASMDDIGSPIEDRDCSSSISTASLSDPLPHTLSHSYSSAHISPYSPTFKQHYHHHQSHGNQGSYTHEEDRMQYASLEDRFPFLKDDRKRTRKLLSPEQTRILEAILERTIYPSTPLREAVARQLGIPPRKVQIWFQNKRQGRRRVPGSGEEMDPMNGTNDISMSTDIEEEDIDSEEKGNSPTSPAMQQNGNPTASRERCLEHQSAADDMRLARLRDEYGRQFAELKIAPAFCDGDMYPAPHLGQFERYGGGPGDQSTPATTDNSAISSPTSAPPYNTSHTDGASYAQRRHTISWQHQDGAIPNRVSPDMHNQRNWTQIHAQNYRVAEWEHGSHESHHHGPQLIHDSQILRPAYADRRGYQYHPGSQGNVSQDHPSPVHHPSHSGTGPLRAYHDRYPISHVDQPGNQHHLERDSAYILRRRGFSNAPYPSPLALHRSYSNHNPYERLNGLLRAEPMHRSYTSASVAPYSPMTAVPPSQHHHPAQSHWNTPRLFNGNSSYGSNSRYQMPPPPSPADMPPTPMSSRSYRSFFQDHRSSSNVLRSVYHQEQKLLSPKHIQPKDRFGQNWNEKRIGGYGGKYKDEMGNENRKEITKDEDEVDDAYEKVTKIDSMPLVSKLQSSSESVTNKITSLADVALRQKIRLAPLRIPTSTLAAFEKVKEAKKERQSPLSEDQQKLQQPGGNPLNRRMSSNDLRVEIGKVRSSSMDLETAPPSPQSAKEVRMKSPTTSPNSPIAPINRVIEISSSLAPVVKTIANERLDCLPSISEIMQN